MNKFITPLDKHFEGFKSEICNLLPAHIRWDSNNGDFKEISPTKSHGIILSPQDFDDNYSDELTEVDKDLLCKYFKSFDHLKRNFGTITFSVGGKETNIKLSNHKPSICFQVPRNSLMKAVSYEIFDDLLIGNFMKTTLYNCDSLYPNFTPYVAKYGDNGVAHSASDLEKYFTYYKLNSADYWKDMLNIQTESIIRKTISSDSMVYKAAKNLRDRLVS
jgi:hypothetical protein